MERDRLPPDRRQLGSYQMSGEFKDFTAIITVPIRISGRISKIMGDFGHPVGPQHPPTAPPPIA